MFAIHIIGLIELTIELMHEEIGGRISKVRGMRS